MTTIKKSKYKQISFKEHTLRKGMLIGDTDPQTIETYILVNDRFELQDLKYPPALLKIIDEVIVNVIDQHTKFPALVTWLKVNVEPTGTVTVENNGPGIEVELTENINNQSMYSPQLIFSEFLSGENLDETEDETRIVGGQNGVGVKLTSLFSKSFHVAIDDELNQIHYEQTFLNNLEEIQEPVITKLDQKKPVKGRVKITFTPDYAKFHIDFYIFYQTFLEIVRTRLWQAAAFTCGQLIIQYNGSKIKLNSFTEFCEKFTESELCTIRMESTEPKYVNCPWDICIGITDGKDRQVSVVNGVCLYLGGTHIKYIQNQIVENLRPTVEREIKKSGSKFNRNIILSHIFIFARGRVPNVKFIGQVKESLQIPIDKFASYTFPPGTWKKVWNVIQDTILSLFWKKQMGETKTRTVRGKIDVPGYTEAKFCRNAKLNKECGLIITEGDSATGTANIGLLSEASEQFNYDYFGVFSIQGVMMNGLKESINKIKKNRKYPIATELNLPAKITEVKCSDTSKSRIKLPNKRPAQPELSTKIFVLPPRIPNLRLKKNERITSLMKAIGLDYNKKYDLTATGDKEWKTLRYGFVVGLTDQDLDGFNIFGLLATFFLAYWPALIERGFIRRINTPLRRAYPKNAYRKTHMVEVFYNDKQVDEFITANTIEYVKKHYDCPFEYYKGLGSHIEAFKEVTNMFLDINSKICTYILDQNAIENMQIYYGSNTSLRKIALATPVNYEPVDGLAIPLSQQYCVDSKLFQRDNIIRKLLNMVDGFVSSRRKVFYTVRSLDKKKIKVIGLAGQVIDVSDYCHGDASLAKTIIRMAQSFPGARNLPLLQPLGMFGSRESGYKNPAASRYIYTQQNWRLAQTLFRPEDDYLLEYEFTDGKRVEPKFYVPIIPYVLCENNMLPATGWAISINARHIDHIFRNVRAMINKTQSKCEKMPIWKTGHSCAIRVWNNQEYFVGKYTREINTNIIEICDLPPNMCSSIYIKGAKESVKKRETRIKREADLSKNKRNLTQQKLNTLLENNDLDNDIELEDHPKSTRTPSIRGIQRKEWVLDVIDKTTMNAINIQIELKPGAVEYIEKHYGNEKFDCYEEYFELKDPIYHRINLVNQVGEVVEYKKYEDVFNDWFVFRKNLYAVRIERELLLINLEIRMLMNQQRFTQEHQKYSITQNTTEETAVEILIENKYDIFNKSILNNPAYKSINELVDLITKSEHGANYDYLLLLNYRTLTKDAYDKRSITINKLKERLKLLETASDTTIMFKGALIWLQELDELEQVINEGIKSNWFFGENDYIFEKPKHKSSN